MSKRRAWDKPSPCEDIDTVVPTPDLANKPSDSSGTLFPLLRRCLDSDEPDAWAELFLLVAQTAAPPVRSVLRHFGVSELETEAVVLELFEKLYLDDGKLRSFRGQNEAEFVRGCDKSRLISPRTGRISANARLRGKKRRCRGMACPTGRGQTTRRAGHVRKNGGRS